MLYWHTMIKVKVKRSNSGLGLFAVITFKKGDPVIEYTGEKITKDEANRRGGKYLFELNDQWTIDGKERKNLARYINHSCKPNCYPQLNKSETRVFIYAKRKISPGEEITYDYGQDYFERIIRPIGCKCSHCATKKLAPLK